MSDRVEQKLRALLVEEADTMVAVGDPVPRVQHRMRVRARHRATLVATCLVVITSVAVGLAAGLGLRGTRGAVDPVDRPTPRVVESSRVPWCVQADPAGALIVGAGPTIRTQCSGLHWYFWHHAGSTVLATPGGVYRVADGRLTRLGTVGSGKVRMSQDGRYAVWQTEFPTNCGAITLYVYDVPTANQIATTRVPDGGCMHVKGIDDLGRVYVTVDRRATTRPGEDVGVLMYDMWTGEWAEVTNLPAVDGPDSITYVTAEGLAVKTEEQVIAGNTLAVRSVEGIVDSDGHFLRRREVPVGVGLWSPDRELVVEQRPGKVVVRRAVDLSTEVMLDLPVGQFRGEEWTNMQWESSRSVLVQAHPGLIEQNLTSERAYRCDIQSGACKLVGRAGVMALGNNQPAPG